MAKSQHLISSKLHHHLLSFCYLALLGSIPVSTFLPVSARPLPQWNIITSSSSASSGSNPWSIASLEYYVQVLVGGEDIGVLIPAINSSATYNFGYTELFAFNVTEGADPLSTQLGFVRGFNVQASYDSSVYGVEVESVSYNDGSLNGTIQLQGQIIAGTNEVAVVGGTGDFRGVKGYAIVTQVNSTGNLILYHHDLHFL